MASRSSHHTTHEPEYRTIQREGQGEETAGLGGMASAVTEKAQDVASAVADTARGAWDGTREEVQRAASAVAGTAGDVWGDLTGFMRRYPFGTLFLGVGIGFLLAQVLEQRGTTGRLRRMGSDLYGRVRDYASDAVSGRQS